MCAPLPLRKTLPPTAAEPGKRSTALQVPHLEVSTTCSGMAPIACEDCGTGSCDLLPPLYDNDPDALRLLREVVKSQGERTDLVDNVNEEGRSSGNSKDYTLDRLARERPDLYEDVVQFSTAYRRASGSRIG